MAVLQTLFGEGRNLDCLQMSCRAVVAFFVTLLLIRIAGQRTFGKRSAMDNVVMIMLGAILSRAVVGSSPVLPVVCACVVMSLTHRLLSWISVYSDAIGKIVKGEHHRLFKEGVFEEDNMKKLLISKKDIMEGVRLQINGDELEEIDSIFIERNGQISVVKKTGGA